MYAALRSLPTQDLKVREAHCTFFTLLQAFLEHERSGTLSGHEACFWSPDYIEDVVLSCEGFLTCRTFIMAIPFKLFAGLRALLLEGSSIRLE